ncbi:hypothetical protein F4801DRAFT_603245 [Xylaria longipes]|nr:hypothetical protein F4801DRAFT_603245 [Xylaria longipes]
MVVRDFSLSCSSDSSNALVNPYDVETADNYAYTDADGSADDDAGGWLALHKRRHQRAFAPYLAAAAAAAKRPPTPDDPLSRARAEILRMALEFETEVSDENSVLASTAPSAAVGAGVLGDVAGPSAVPLGDRLHKTSFLGHCRKALARKRSFWKKKEEN